MIDQTREGTFVFNKSSCSLSGYNNTGYLIIPQDSYAVLSSLNGSNIWNTVNTINNAACTTSVNENNGTLTVSGTKTVSGTGIFSITYTKVPTLPLKLTFSATNNNPAWTKYHIGLRETIIIPRFISLGNQTYDLSLYNNTVLSRNWISGHNAQLIKLSNYAYYNMGLGWNNANTISIHYIHGQAIITIDYTNNTPILSPGQTITVDPGITLDTANTAESSAASSISTAVTIGSNNNRLLIVSAGSYGSGVGPNIVSGITFDSVSMTELPTTSTSAFNTNGMRNVLFYLIAPHTGTHTLVITYAGSNTFNAAGWDSLYNVDQSTGMQNGNHTSYTASTFNYVQAKPTLTGSQLFGASIVNNNIGSGSNTVDYASTANLGKGGQRITSPTINSVNSMNWGNNPGSLAVNVAGEVIAVQSIGTPSITHANTLNSTAIKLDWPAVPNAVWYAVYMASPNGGTFSKVANQSSNTFTKNSLTSGTQYVFKVLAGNATLGTGSNSTIKSNYTSNIAPTNLNAINVLTISARITWTNPSGNLTGFKIERSQPPGVGWTTLQSNTNNSTQHYDLTGLTGGLQYGVRISTNYAFGTNSSNTSSPSSTVTFSSNIATTGTETMVHTTVGDTIRLNATTNIITGSPSPVNLRSLALYVNNVLYKNQTINQNITQGGFYNFTSFWYQFTDASSKNFTAKARVTNNTGLINAGVITIKSANYSFAEVLNPKYIQAVDPTLGNVNYTLTNRTLNVNTVILKVTRQNLGSTLFPIECLYQTAAQAAGGVSGGGTWYNVSSTGFYNYIFPATASANYYITCYDPGILLVSTSYSNGTLLQGIAYFDSTFKGFIGVPTGVLALLMFAGLATGRTAPTMAVIVLAVAAIMTSVGFFAIGQNVWGICLIAAACALFGGKKFL